MDRRLMKLITFLVIIGVAIVLVFYTKKIGIFYVAGALIMGGCAIYSISEYYSEPKGQRNSQWIFSIIYHLGFTIALTAIALYFLIR